MVVLSFLRAFVRSRAALAVENLALLQQLVVLCRSVNRPKLRLADRVFWVLLRRQWSGWRGSLLLVRPATLVAWHRQGWRLLWRWRSRSKPGRPPIPLVTRELIRRLAGENCLWGAPRIQLELERLSVQVAKSTVEKHMRRRRGSPSTAWREFLRAEAEGILACDFFTIPTASFKAITGFVVMELGERRTLAVDVTAHPTGEWAATVVERTTRSMGTTARFLLGDREGIYGAAFSARVRDLGMRQVVTAYRAPRMNAHCERLIGTLRRKFLDHLIVMGAGHARGLLGEYAKCYNSGRSHQALRGETPKQRPRLVTGAAEVVSTPVLHGLHHAYRRAA